MADGGCRYLALFLKKYTLKRTIVRADDEENGEAVTTVDVDNKLDEESKRDEKQDGKETPTKDDRSLEAPDVAPAMPSVLKPKVSGAAPEGKP
jgi:hypothetical protein